MRKLTEKDVTFDVECLPEDLQIEGNAMASGDAEADKEVEDWIKSELRRGNEWAWCTVKVTARWEEYEGTDYLGACSYRSEQEFKKDGYYEDMKDRALEDLNEKVSKAHATLRRLE